MMFAERPGPVVVGVDYSTAGALAVSYAAWEARRRGLGLRLVHGFVASEPGAERAMLVTAEARLSDASAEVRAAHPGLPISTKVVAGSGAMTLVAESKSASLVIVGARGRGGFDGLLLGSVAAQVAKHALCPVIVMRTPIITEDGVPGTKKVLVGVDGSARSVGALSFAFDHAAACGVPLVAVHVWSVPTMTARSVGTVWSRDLRTAREQLRGGADRVLTDELAGWSEKYPQVNVERRTVHGDEPARTLLAVAEELMADLIVVGARESTGSDQVLDSVSQPLVAHAKASVAVIHSDQNRG